MYKNNNNVRERHPVLTFYRILILSPDKLNNSLAHTNRSLAKQLDAFLKQIDKDRKQVCKVLKESFNSKPTDEELRQTLEVHPSLYNALKNEMILLIKVAQTYHYHLLANQAKNAAKAYFDTHGKQEIAQPPPWAHIASINKEHTTLSRTLVQQGLLIGFCNAIEKGPDELGQFLQKQPQLIPSIHRMTADTEGDDDSTHVDIQNQRKAVDMMKVETTTPKEQHARANFTPFCPKP